MKTICSEIDGKLLLMVLNVNKIWILFPQIKHNNKLFKATLNARSDMAVDFGYFFGERNEPIDDSFCITFIFSV